MGMMQNVNLLVRCCRLLQETLQVTGNSKQIVPLYSGEQSIYKLLVNAFGEEVAEKCKSTGIIISALESLSVQPKEIVSRVLCGVCYKKPSEKNCKSHRNLHRRIRTMILRGYQLKPEAFVNAIPIALPDPHVDSSYVPNMTNTKPKTSSRLSLVVSASDIFKSTTQMKRRRESDETLQTSCKKTKSL